MRNAMVKALRQRWRRGSRSIVKAELVKRGAGEEVEEAEN
jgi:hypothetical protein